MLDRARRPIAAGFFLKSTKISQRTLSEVGSDADVPRVMTSSNVSARPPYRRNGRTARAPPAIVLAVATMVALLQLKASQAFSPLPSPHRSRHGGDGCYQPIGPWVGALAPQRLGSLAAKKKGKKGGKAKQPKTRLAGLPSP